MPKNAKVCKSRHKYAKECKSMQKQAQVCKSLHEHAKDCTSMQKQAQVCKRLHKYAKDYTSMQKHIFSAKENFMPTFFSNFVSTFLCPFLTTLDIIRPNFLSLFLFCLLCSTNFVLRSIKCHYPF